MRKFVFITLLVALFLPVKSQNCNFYLPFEEGKGFKYEFFNKRDKLETVQEMVIKEVKSGDDYLEAVIHAKLYDKKEELIYEGEYSIFCRDGKLEIDLQSMLDPRIMEGFRDMEVEITSENIEVPNNPKVGDVLPSATMNMIVSMEGMKMSEMNFTTKDRTVTDRETITVPAGTFDCLRISYTNESQVKAMGMTRTNEAEVIEYHAPEVGNIKSVFYDQKGRMDGYSVLVDIF